MTDESTHTFLTCAVSSPACVLQGYSALHYAVHCGHEGVARTLLASGADVL